MKSIVMLLAVTTIATRVPPARAQSASDTDYVARRYYVTVSASSRTAAMRITPVGSSEPIATCANQCEFQGLPGRYLLDAEDRETGEHHRLGFRVRRPTSFHFEEGDPTARVVGAGVGTLGGLSFAVGLGLILANASLGENAPDQTAAQHRASQVGIGLFLGSLLAIPTGWIIFAQNRARIIQGYDPNTARSSSIKLGLICVNGGLGLGGSAPF